MDLTTNKRTKMSLKGLFFLHVDDRLESERALFFLKPFLPLLRFKKERQEK
jgi:hypothetical protein